MGTWDHLDAFHLDVLKEIGNIGAGNAATALAAMLNQRINMNVPRAGVLPLREIPNLIGQEEDPVACVEFGVTGKAPGKIFFLLTQESAFSLVDFLLGQPSGTTQQLDNMGVSVLMEVGNILTGSFLTAFAEFCRLEFIPSVPAFAFDMLGAVLSSAFLEGGYFSDQALVIETQFYSPEAKISGYFFLIPEEQALGVIMESLGVNF
ncbi:chemotaxis protein CheC [Thermanaeromonas toyohensis ToBE]|uniref:Chemotaxis protein CheC n=1 Tax=Thermanaeromonas toyohensis ToBE TaxID=698762 RepID=A0A1W1VMF6_9FIRM|nr:chemotaxis protein CheC [Thermanaeromonas toyohensis]SMB94134.1 chemotaxis protein CheC [Thermanaeromonas toyohensis ToBE]